MTIDNFYDYFTLPSDRLDHVWFYGILGEKNSSFVAISQILFFNVLSF